MDEQKHKDLEQAKWEENVRRTEEAAKKIFPHEKWADAVSIKFKYHGEDFDLPIGIENIKVARSRLTHIKNDEQILAKEIKQGKILAEKGAYIYLLPKLKSPDGKYIPGPDALVNGVLFEFKTVTGSIKKVERRFRESREQCKNVFIKIDNPNVSKAEVTADIKLILNDKKYTGGTGGILIIYLSQTKKTYSMQIKDLK